MKGVHQHPPPPPSAQQSFEVLDAEGKAIRYRTSYFDKLPEQKLGRRGNDPGAGRIQQQAAAGGASQRGQPQQ